MPKTIVLDYKGSAQSGNRMHAGRPGLVGGSKPRNYGDAMAAYSKWSVAPGFIPHPDALNRVGLQAIIDYQAGLINATDLQRIANDPNSQKGAKPASTPVAAATAAGIAAPPAPIPPITQTTADPQLQAQALSTFNSWPYKYRHQFPVDMNSLNDKGLQAVLDMQAKKITPADMYKIVNDPSAHKTGVVTPPPWQTKPATAPAAQPIPVPPPPPPAPPKDPRFYQGKITPQTSAEEIFKGSSPEIQALALKTGILATDKETFDYVSGKVGTQLAKQPQYIKDYQNHIDMGSAQNLHTQYYDWEQNGGRNLYGESNPFYNARRLNNQTGFVATNSNLTPAERALVDKMAAAHDEHDKNYTATVNNYMATVNNYGAGYNRYNKANIDLQNAIDASWKSLTPQEQQLARELNVRYGTAQWIGENVPRTFFKGSRREVPANYTAPGIDKIKYDPNIDVVRAGFDYRNQFLARKTPVPTAGYKQNEVLALSKLDPHTEQSVKDRFDSTWDHVQHSSFSGTVNAAYQIHPQKKVLDNFAAFAPRDNADDNLFHGTHYEAAQSIASNGYKVFPSSQAKAGRAMGDGIYLADKSSKSAQYLHSAGGIGVTRHSQNGVMFVNKVYKGNQVDITSNQYYSGNYDTVFGGKGYWRNNEWAVKDAGAVLPNIWIDVGIT